MSVNATPSFGAYFQCHKNPLSTYKCLESFRRFYPTNSIVLVSDNGHDYTEMARLFKCVYIHCEHSLVYIHREMNNGTHVDHGMKLMKRILDALVHIKEDYFMWLEDDVVINKPVDDIFRYDINGYCPHSFKKETLVAINNKYPNIDPGRDYRWSGHGGSVIKKSSILRCFYNTITARALLENWHQYKLLEDEMPQDYLFSLLMWLNKFTIGPYSGHADGINNELDENIHVQHQYKCYYGMQLPREYAHLVKL
jgi:hypothetical protein